MFKHVYYLTKLQIYNLFGLNEARFSRDQKKRRTVMTTLVAYLILGGVLTFYSAGLSVALASMGFAEVLPLYLAVFATCMIFGLTVFRAGALFGVKAYENLAVLPVSQTAIVASKFLSLYIVNFLFSFVITASGGIACGATVGGDLWFYLSMILSSVFLPLLPMTIALIFGTVIYAIVSRFKRKSVTHTLFTLAVLVGVLLFPMTMDSGQTDAEFLTDIAAMITSVGQALPPLIWLANGVKIQGIGWYFLFAGTSVLVFAAFSCVVGRFYKKICSGLSASATKGNFAVGAQKSQSALFALYKKELKRYFASSIYFTNTIIGNLLALILSVSCLFLGVESLGAEMGLPTKIIHSFLPFLLAAVLNIAPMTACSISMEGKGWELTKSLPVSAKTVMDSKLLVQFTFALPTVVFSEILLWIAFKPTGFALVWLLLAPILFGAFGGVIGLYINIKHPTLHWESETTAVKQSTSTLLAMLVGMASGALPLVIVAVSPAQIVDWLVAFILLGVFAATGFVYKKITSISLHTIDGK